MKYLIIALTIIFSTLENNIQSQDSLYHSVGNVQFISEAPLETIQAKSDQLNGILNIAEKTFAFSFQVNSFQGFNSPLQREHFNDYYLETANHPKASFVGNLIGWKDCEADCNQSIIAKGKFTIKGITKIMNIPVSINYSSKEDKIVAYAVFDIELSDYEINIPIILEAKISPIINVIVDVTFTTHNE